MINLSDSLQELKQSYTQEIAACQSENDLQLIKSRLLGKKSQLNIILKQVAQLTGDQRQSVGQEANALKADIGRALQYQSQAILQQLEDLEPAVDLSIPLQCTMGDGRMHPTQRVMQEIYDIFLRLGFAIVDGPEVETDWYNFEALNMPADHPAREMQDTFYIKATSSSQSFVPRTHTSSVQVRYMEDHQPPFQIIAPGKVYRNENEDRTHSWSFYQVEGLVVGEDISVADLKGTLLHVMQGLLGESVRVRLRPSYFPYTEPSFEVDVWYDDEWLEICGAGIVHPDVLRRCQIDPERWSGFAFGFGPDRIAVVKYGLKDLRGLWRPNLLEGLEP